MNATDYARIEELVARAETIMTNRALLNPRGKLIHAEIRELLQRVTTARVKCELEEAKRALPR